VVVAKELPIGSSREDIEAWGVRRGIALTYTQQLRWLSGDLEDVVVPHEGPCDTWNIEVVVTLDDRTRSRKQVVEPPRSAKCCLLRFDRGNPKE
jgi:hypothetical protein